MDKRIGNEVSDVLDEQPWILNSEPGDSISTRVRDDGLRRKVMLEQRPESRDLTGFDLRCKVMRRTLGHHRSRDGEKRRGLALTVGGHNQTIEIRERTGITADGSLSEVPGPQDLRVRIGEGDTRYGGHEEREDEDSEQEFPREKQSTHTTDRRDSKTEPKTIPKTRASRVPSTRDLVFALLCTPAFVDLTARHHVYENALALAALALAYRVPEVLRRLQPSRQNPLGKASAIYGIAVLVAERPVEQTLPTQHLVVALIVGTGYLCVGCTVNEYQPRHNKK